MKKLLVLTDFSEKSVNAYRYAVELACHVKSDIVLVFSTNGNQVTPTAHADYSQMLNSFAKRYACVSRVKINPQHTECLVSAEKWALLIPQLLKLHHPDLVIAPPELLNGFEQTEPVSSLKNFEQCPLILVPEKATFKPVQNLVFITDFTDQDPAIIYQLKTLSLALKTSINLLHFYPNSDWARIAEIKKEATKLQKSLSPLKSSFQLIEEENLVEGLQDYAEENPVDLFVLATRDSHLAYHYFLPVYRKTNTCQVETPLLNLYQNKKKPCAGDCHFCLETQTSENVPELQPN